MMYLYRNWAFSWALKENASRLIALADNIFQSYAEIENEALPVDAIVETIKIADTVYDLSHRILREHHLFVFLLPVRHRREDAFCRRLQMTDGSMEADIYMLIPHIDYEATPQSIFLDELGHSQTLP